MSLLQFYSRKFLAILIKLVVTATLIYWLLSGIDYPTVRTTFSRISADIILLAIAIHFCVFLLGGLRWWLLLRHVKVRPPFVRILPSYYLGLFFNNILPTGMGGDVVRALHLNMSGLSVRALAASTIVDRVIGMLVVLIVGATCLLLAPDIPILKDGQIYLIAFVLISVAGTAFLLSPWFGTLLALLQKRYGHTRIRRGLLDIARLCYSYKTSLRLISFAAVISLAMQSMVIYVYYLLSRGVGIELSMITYFAIIPIVFLAASLPISIGGLGVREGVLVGLLITMSVDKQLAISLSLLYLAILWLSTAPGAVVLLNRTSRPTK